VDGIVSRDPSYWNTLVYRSDQVTIQNYKVVNCRPSAVGGYNQTGGIGNSSGATSALVQRVIGRVDMNGNSDTSTALTDVSSGQPFRSAYSSNGTDMWASGGSGTALPAYRATALGSHRRGASRRPSG
jgi:acyl-homoserine lactone acylase PvdQ